MAETSAFEFVCEKLEERTSFDRLEARGTVRLALKSAGLEPRSISSDQMKVVLEKVLPGELAARGIEDSEAVCRTLATQVIGVAGSGENDSPEEVFARLGRS